MAQNGEMAPGEDTEKLLEIYKKDAEEKDEYANLTPDEKTAWLRSKGVFIETVEERKAAAEARKNKKFDGAAGIYDIRPGMPPPPMSFKYVRVPCDDSVAFEEIQGHGYDACDNFLEMLKPQFAGGNVDSEKAQRAAMQHLGNSVPTLGDKGLSTLTDAAEDGAVETFALVKPASSNKHTGVYIYLDEVGMLKGLPPNRRAAGIAKTCGFDDAQFFGDVFIGRVQITPSPMHNIDFCANDLDSGARWLKAATTENYDYNMGMRQISDTMADMRGGGGADNEVEKEEEGYKWSQDGDDLEITVDLESDVTKKDLKISFGQEKVSVKVKGETKIELTLFDKIRPDECNWTLSKGKLTLTMEKQVSGSWPNIVRWSDATS